MFAREDGASQGWRSLVRARAWAKINETRSIAVCAIAPDSAVRTCGRENRLLSYRPPSRRPMTTRVRRTEALNSTSSERIIGYRAPATDAGADHRRDAGKNALAAGVAM